MKFIEQQNKRQSNGKRGLEVRTQPSKLLPSTYPFISNASLLMSFTCRVEERARCAQSTTLQDKDDEQSGRTKAKGTQLFGLPASSETWLLMPRQQ
jgi:hypothetical protein